MTKLVKGLYPFWCGTLADEARTDAVFSIDPIPRTEELMRFTDTWEEVGGSYVNVIKDGGLYRMYYHVMNNEDGTPGCHTAYNTVTVCYAESRDGRHWVKPSLGLVEYRGSTDNNIIIKHIEDNFTVMLDKNPACPPKERYKALISSRNTEDIFDTSETGERFLMLMTSPDGLRFTMKGLVSKGYQYDSQNTLLWSKERGEYICYFRFLTMEPEDPDSPFDDRKLRRIMVMRSKDLVSWTEPRPVEFIDSDVYPMYTNGITPYLYDSRYLVGFPTRYNQRKSWDDSFERLCGKEARLERMKENPRFGLAVSDTVFMCSTDGEHFTRYDEAFITPGPEREGAWEYGSCYTALGCPVETEPTFAGCEPELSFYLMHRPWGYRAVLYRAVCRKDGFGSYKADYKGKTLITLPLEAAGGGLAINFATSARGHIRVRVLDEDCRPIDGCESCLLFGDSTERIVDFGRPFAELSGKTVRLSFEMKDARIYAFKVI